MPGFVKDIKDFFARGNLLEFAVGLLLALVLWPVVDAVIDGMVLPLIAMIFSQDSFNGLSFTINDAHFYYGAAISPLVTLAVVAVAVYFGAVRPFNLWETADQDEDEDEDTSLLRQIRDSVRR